MAPWIAGGLGGSTAHGRECPINPERTPKASFEAFLRRKWAGLHARPLHPPPLLRSPPQGWSRERVLPLAGSGLGRMLMVLPTDPSSHVKKVGPLIPTSHAHVRACAGLAVQWTSGCRHAPGPPFYGSTNRRTAGARDLLLHRANARLVARLAAGHAHLEGGCGRRGRPPRSSADGRRAIITDRQLKGGAGLTPPDARRCSCTFPATRKSWGWQ